MTLASAPRNPVQVPPARRPRSIRRTSTVMMHWPGGIGTNLQLDGIARDLVTAAGGEPAVTAHGSMTVVVGRDRVIESVTVTPDAPGIAQLVGAQGGGRLREVIEAAAAPDRDAGTPLYLLLDDIAGTTLIAGFAWSRWREVLSARLAAATGAGSGAGSGTSQLAKQAAAARSRKMEGVCAGFRPGSGALVPGGFLNTELDQNVAPVPPIGDEDDPIGWHEMPPHPAVAMRRARRIDVFTEGDDVVIDAMFRDSTWGPDGVEVAVHEYHLDARADARSGRLTAVAAEPRVLPYPECPAAAANAGRMVGTPLSALRSAVLASLRGTDCCTHLNDALRSLAEVPTLCAVLAQHD
jgi:hypothetical protein